MMSELNPNDSDCIIEEQHVTCITIDDSQAEESEEEQAPPPPPLVVQEVEDGEVSENEDDSICEIKYPNKNEFKLFGELITNSLKQILRDHLSGQLGQIFEIVEEEVENYIKLTVREERQFDTTVEDIPMPSEAPAKIEERTEIFKKDVSPDLSGISELFTIDTSPAPKIDIVKVPSYKRAVKDALLDEEAAAKKKQKAEVDTLRMKKVNTCFNCGDAGHSIRECSKPHNAKRIKSAKRSKKVERYHVDVEQKFAHLKPGFISDKLREALDLRKGEIPFFFYRMRVLGYPPGWLEDAKVEHSGINLFNSDGTKILHSDEDEGEIDPVNHKYNISKICDFPGFNQDPGENFFDDYQYHNVPPFDKRQVKEAFIKTLGDNVLKGYKRKKLKDFPNTTTESIDVQEATDMDIEDPETTVIGEVQFTRPPPPSDQPPSPPPPPPPASSSSSCESPITVSDCRERESSTQSPSLIELERQKRRLLRELQSSTVTIEVEDSLIDEIIELDEEDDKRHTHDSNTDNTCDNTSQSTAEDPKDATEMKTTVVKESFMGTPVLKFSPFDNLPNGENFKVGVSDVINFENLPDSTGKYEQMKEVIKKVRNCITKLQSDE